jgi:hypothetical protein
MHIVEQAYSWHQTNGRFLERHRRDPKVHLVTYEELVTEPEGTMKRVCDFLGEAFTPSILEREGAEDGSSASAASSTSERLQHADTRARNDETAASFSDWRAAHRRAAKGPVTADSLTKWKKHLSRFETAIVEAVCEEPMNRAGYELQSSPSERRLARLVAEALYPILNAEDRVRAVRVRRKIAARPSGSPPRPH